MHRATIQVSIERQSTIQQLRLPFSFSMCLRARVCVCFVDWSVVGGVVEGLFHCTKMFTGWFVGEVKTDSQRNETKTKG